MTDGLVPLAQLAGGEVFPAAMVFLRVGAMMALLPAFGDATIPARLRLVLTLAFSAAIFPAVRPHVPDAPDLRAAGGEVLAGLLLGMGLRFLILALQTAGAMAAQAASLAAMVPTGAEPQPAIATLFTLAALALAVQAGLHVRVAELLVLSYTVFPAGTAPPAQDAAEWGVARAGQAMGLAFSLAAPFVLVGMLWNVALGAMNRAMPQLMVMFVGAPALSLGALALLALCAPLIVQLWQGVLADALAAPVALP